MYINRISEGSRRPPGHGAVGSRRTPGGGAFLPLGSRRCP